MEQFRASLQTCYLIRFIYRGDSKNRPKFITLLQATAVTEGAKEAVQGLADSQPVSYHPSSYPSSIVLQHPWVLDQLE